MRAFRSTFVALQFAGVNVLLGWLTRDQPMACRVWLSMESLAWCAYGSMRGRAWSWSS